MSDVLDIATPDERVDYWAREITAAWQSSVEECGSRIAAAKEDLPHGNFISMIEDRLPFGRKTAHMLMTVARDPLLSNVQFTRHLPPDWYTLYRLSTLKLAPPEFQAWIDDGRIHAAMRLLAGPSVPEEARAENSTIFGSSLTSGSASPSAFASFSPRPAIGRSDGCWASVTPPSTGTSAQMCQRLARHQRPPRLPAPLLPQMCHR